VKHTRRFAKTLYGMISGDERSWAFVLAEANRIPGRRVFRDLKRLSPFDGHDIIIVEGSGVEGDFSRFFERIETGARIWKMRLGKPPHAPLIIALAP